MPVVTLVMDIDVTPPLSDVMIRDVGQPVDLLIVILADLIERPLFFGVSTIISFPGDDFSIRQLKLRDAELIISKGLDSMSSSPVGSVMFTSLVEVMYDHWVLLSNQIEISGVVSLKSFLQMTIEPVTEPLSCMIAKSTVTDGALLNRAAH